MTDTLLRPLESLQAAIGSRYRLEGEAGAGGMATVYSAQDVRHARRVAIKVFRPDLASALGAERFLREIEIAARLQHPHIVGLLDSGADADLLYYVMPFIDGMSLRARLAREGELPLDDGLRLLHQVLDALAFAHGLGIVHRDIKPENVLLAGYTARPSSRWHALVADFGVAKAVSEATADDTSLTGSGISMGTPAYMAPEQAAAEPNVDHRADLYAVGALAYELFAGVPPFTGATVQQIIAAHMTRRPESLRTHRPAISPELDQLILRCLEKRPADRWRTADEILVRLDGMMTPAHSTGTGAFYAPPRVDPVERTFRLTERVCRTLDRATLDPRVIGGDLRYLDNGARSDVLVLMIPGTGQDHGALQEVATSLPFRVVVPTLFGFEPVVRRRIPLSMANQLGMMRELLRAAIDESAPSTVIVGGFSAGADMALRLIVETENLPRIDGVLTLGCNLSIETCWATGVFSRVLSNDEASIIEDLRTLSAGIKTIDGWINAHEYFIDVLRKFGSDFEAIRRFCQEIVAPFEAGDPDVFARWFRVASERTRAVRCVSEETDQLVRIIQDVRMRNLDAGVLGDRYRDDSIILEPDVSHFDLIRPDFVRRHLDALLDAAR